MDAETLRDLQRKEKMTPYLQELSRDFYKELKEYLRGLLRDIKESRKTDTTRLALKVAEYENIKNMVSDLYETRERKIVSNALYYVKSGDKVDTTNLTREEEEVLIGIVSLLRDKRHKVLEKVLGEEGEEKEKEKVEEKDLEEPEEEQDEGSPGEEKEERQGDYVTVRILKDLPSIVGVDGRVYGAFKKEDVVTLPRANAETLINRGAAEKIGLGKVFI